MQFVSVVCEPQGVGSTQVPADRHNRSRLVEQNVDALASLHVPNSAGLSLMHLSTRVIARDKLQAGRFACRFGGNQGDDLSRNRT